MPSFPKQVGGLDPTPVEDGAIIYDSSSERVHYLNPTAALVLELCDGNTDALEMARLLKDHFDLTEAPLADVEAVLAQLLDEKLIDEDGAESPLSAESAS